MAIPRPASVTCPECGRNVLVTRSGRTHRHRRTVKMGPADCPGGNADVTRGWALVESSSAPLPADLTSQDGAAA